MKQGDHLDKIRHNWILDWVQILPIWRPLDAIKSNLARIAQLVLPRVHS